MAEQEEEILRQVKDQILCEVSGRYPGPLDDITNITAKEARKAMDLYLARILENQK